jgi:hypothetical protein
MVRRRETKTKFFEQQQVVTVQKTEEGALPANPAKVDGASPSLTRPHRYRLPRNRGQPTLSIFFSSQIVPRFR